MWAGTLGNFLGWGIPLYHFVALCGRRAQRGDCAAAWLLGVCWALTSFAVTSPTPHMWLVPFQLFPGVESHSGWVCVPFKSVMGPLSRVFWKSGSFFHCPHPHWFLHPEVMGIYSPHAGTLSCVIWLGAGIAHSQGITSIFYLPHVNVGALMPILPPPLHTTPHLLAFPPYLHVSTPPPHLDECGFFKSLVVGLPYSSIFWQFWMLFVLRFHCNSFYSCIRRWSVSTYASILTGSKKCSDILNV